jgi:hypothetical protein
MGKLVARGGAMIGHNNPPPEHKDSLFEMPPDYVDYILNAARPGKLANLTERMALPKVRELIDKLLDALAGPPADLTVSAGQMLALLRLVEQPAKAADDRRRALQRKRQSRPEYKARKRKREREYRSAVSR